MLFELDAHEFYSTLRPLIVSPFSQFSARLQLSLHRVSPLPDLTCIYIYIYISPQLNDKYFFPHLPVTAKGCEGDLLLYQKLKATERRVTGP